MAGGAFSIIFKKDSLIDENNRTSDFYWGPDTEGIYNAGSWEAELESGYYRIKLDAFLGTDGGAWTANYQPIKVKFTFTGTIVDTYISNSNGSNTIPIENIESGVYYSLSGLFNDSEDYIDRIEFHTISTLGSFTVTAIEFSFVAPTGDDFSVGIGNWTTEVSDSDAAIDWYQDNSMRIAVNNGNTSIEDDWGRATWNYTLSGDWDVEVNYQLLSGSGSPYNMHFRLMVVGTASHQVVIMWTNQAGLGMRSYWYDGSVHEDAHYATKPDGYTENLRLRMTKVGGIFTTYHDPGTGSWTLVKQFSIPAWASESFKPRVQAQRTGITSISAKFDNLVINSGTVA